VGRPPPLPGVPGLKDAAANADAPSHAVSRCGAQRRRGASARVAAREAAADFAAVAPDRPFEQQLEDETVVLGDRIRLRQMIDNLLANAWTHTPTATPVRLSVRRRGQDAELVVADEGPGIPPEAQERVFERFWRADPGRTRQRGSTGLGLAIVASIVAAHGGTVDLASTPGRGTIFTVRLPLATPGRSSSRPNLVTADYASSG
jgi:signal transduction histidine kinase